MQVAVHSVNGMTSLQSLVEGPLTVPSLLSCSVRAGVLGAVVAFAGFTVEIVAQMVNDNNNSSSSSNFSGSSTWCVNNIQ